MMQRLSAAGTVVVGRCQPSRSLLCSSSCRGTQHRAVALLAAAAAPVIRRVGGAASRLSRCSSPSLLPRQRQHQHQRQQRYFSQTGTGRAQPAGGREGPHGQQKQPHETGDRSLGTGKAAESAPASTADATIAATASTAPSSAPPLSASPTAVSGNNSSSGSSSSSATTTTTTKTATNTGSSLTKPALVRENIYTIPNLLTASRLVAAPFLGYCILHEQHTLALGLLAYAGVSDLLDGWIARRWGLGTVVGTIIDPMADKTLMLVLTVSFAAKGALPLWLVSVIIGRDVGLAISAIYYRWVSLPPPKTFMRYWDFSLPSAEVRPTTISKYNTFLQLALMGLTATAPVVPFDLAGPLTAMQYVVGVTTVWSGASYVFSKDAVKILSDARSADKRLK